MPMLPGRMCQSPGCALPAVRGSAYCEEHTKQKTAQRVGAYDVMYKTTSWRKIRKNYLDGHPLCVVCLREGRLTPATEVDHIMPHKGDRKLFYDINNLQALCKPCHSAKTAKEDGGFGHARQSERRRGS